MTDFMTSWVKGWMLGKYNRYEALEEGDNFDEWIEGYKWGVTEIGDFENWVYHLALATLKHPQLYFVVHNLAEEACQAQI